MSSRDDVRVVVTLRADFYQHCISIPSLAALLTEGTFPLPTPIVVPKMIRGPAELAGLDFDEDLPDRIVRATGNDPGALALLAYTLDELYRRAEDGKRLTEAAYDELGGVHGAIARRAEDVYARLQVDPETFGRVFAELVSVDESGTATRRRAPLDGLRTDAQTRRLIDEFASARLLMISDTHYPVVEVAHEAVFLSWDRLARWIRQEQEDLILLRQVRQATALWESRGRVDHYLWSGERLKEAGAMVERKRPVLSEGERAFLRSEVDRLMEVIARPTTTDFERAEIGDRLALIGDTRAGVGVTTGGIPDVDWCEFHRAGDEIFDIARYPITYRQYRAFVEASGRDAGDQFRKIDNCPAENVSFDDAVAFCRWVSERLGCTIRLPSRSEWAHVARGRISFEYPWGAAWQPLRANTSESRLARTTAVGMYPLGAAACGACDLGGTVWEWTTTEGPTGNDHLTCGGSWMSDHRFARISEKRAQRDDTRANNTGFRPIRVRRAR
jgi:formylglycine-generating enzyme required for sulfatase activity